MEKIYYHPKMKPMAQELRKNSTRHENQLWYHFLRKHPCQFRRQKQFGRYIVDFYCSAAKLVIELDGSQHFTTEGKEHDRARTAYLESLGLTELRFMNSDIDHHFEQVCKQINDVIQKKLSR